VDVARVDRGLLIAAGSALLLILSLFLPWYAVSASLGPGVPAVSATVTGWESFSYTDLLLFLAAAVAIAAAALTAAGSLPDLPLGVGQIVMGAGALALLLVLFRLLNLPGDTSEIVGVDIGRRIGPFVALIAAAGVMFGGMQASSMTAARRAM